MKFDIRLLTKAADELLPKLTNPLHKAIIANYRRHAMLEVSGRYQEILAPDMMVDNPHYRQYTGGGIVDLQGKEKVSALYKSLVDTRTTVMMLTDEQLMVSDWGFSSESIFHTFMPAWFAVSLGASIDDPGAIYIQKAHFAMHWPYDEKGLLKGEHVYWSVDSYRKCPPEEVLTVEEVREILAPIIADSPPITL